MSPPDSPTETQTQSRGSGKDDPANQFVWPSQPQAGGRNGAGSPGLPTQSPPNLHTGPFSRPLAMGLDSMASPGGPGSPDPSTEVDPTQPDGGTTARSGSQTQNRAGSTGKPSGVAGSSGSQSNSKFIGSSDASGNPPPSGSPPPLTVGMGDAWDAFDGESSAAGLDHGQELIEKDRAPALPEPSTSSITDRRFEIVLVCGPRGVIVMPGGYRVTADALKDRDGLMRKQMVALVKAKRTADPKVNLEPRVRFLVQPGGDKTFWAARSQFLISGLDWPMSTQVADPRPPVHHPIGELVMIDPESKLDQNTPSPQPSPARGEGARTPDRPATEPYWRIIAGPMLVLVALIAPGRLAVPAEAGRAEAAHSRSTHTLRFQGGRG